MTRRGDLQVARHSTVPVVAMDGPAGAGKSTVAREVARRLGLTCIDSGAMYRSIAWRALQNGLDLHDEAAVARLARATRIEFRPSPRGARHGGQAARVIVNGRDAGRSIRTVAVTRATMIVAAMPTVRRILLQRQRALGRRGVVMEGRDIGTHVFPHAGLKIYLSASVAERTRRRYEELRAAGVRVRRADIMADIRRRDRKDRTRATNPLRRAKDAVRIFSTSAPASIVVDRIFGLARQRGLAQ